MTAILSLSRCTLFSPSSKWSFKSCPTEVQFIHRKPSIQLDGFGYMYRAVHPSAQSTFRTPHLSLLRRPDAFHFPPFASSAFGQILILSAQEAPVGANPCFGDIMLPQLVLTATWKKCILETMTGRRRGG